MEVSLVTMQQDLSLEDGSITNFIVLRLPSGHMMRAVIADESVKLLVDNMAHRGAFAAPAVRQPAVGDQPRREVTSEGAVIFGGDGADDPSDDWSTSGGVAMPPVREPGEGQPPSRTWAPEAEEEEVSDRPQTADEQARTYRQKKMKAQANPNSRGINNARTVEKDSDGYPIVSRPGGVDPGELMGGTVGGDVDESGVGSI